MHEPGCCGIARVPIAWPCAIVGTWHAARVPAIAVARRNCRRQPPESQGNNVKTKPVLLAIFDGFGLNPSRAHNAWALARTPHLDHYFASFPHTVLQASGRAVGLPDGQFGNSEVGHLTLGSGRILEQDLIRIANAIYGGSIEQIPAWQSLLSGARRVHLVGLVSDGGVHSHIEHLLGILGLLRQTDVEPVIHMITDGRDTAPRAALGFLAEVEESLASLGRGCIATVSGRYCAMDRAKHWDRTERAWKTMVLGQGFSAATPREAIESAYARGEGDEFIQPTVIVGFTTFGLTLVLLYTMSTLYHSFQAPRLKRVFKVLDHISIYLLIAGTYTPFTLISLGGGWGWTLGCLAQFMATSGVGLCDTMLKSRSKI